MKIINLNLSFWISTTIIFIITFFRMGADKSQESLIKFLLILGAFLLITFIIWIILKKSLANHKGNKSRILELILYSLRNSLRKH